MPLEVLKSAKLLQMALEVRHRFSLQISSLLNGLKSDRRIKERNPNKMKKLFYSQVLLCLSIFLLMSLRLHSAELLGQWLFEEGAGKKSKTHQVKATMESLLVNQNG